MANRVVITGMGCVTPIGNDVESFWNSLKAGRCGIGPITHFDTADHKCKVAAEVKDFDPLQYMEKSEVRKYDLFCQYAMAAATQAVEESGIKGTLPPERIGTYVGSGIGGMGTFAKEQQVLMEKGPRRVSPFFVPGMIINMAGGLIAIKYDFQGASIPIVTACATGNNAIGEAYRAIKHGYLDAVLTGGAEAAIIPIGVAGFSNMRALSTQEDPGPGLHPLRRPPQRLRHGRGRRGPGAGGVRARQGQGRQNLRRAVRLRRDLRRPPHHRAPSRRHRRGGGP